MNALNLKNAIMNGKFDDVLEKIYPTKVEVRKERLCKAVDSFVELYGDCEDIMLFSVPGRSEISGNHTDHNYGKVIAASVDCDIIAVAAPSGDEIVKVKSEGYPGDVINLNHTVPGYYPYFKSASVVAGMCRAFQDKGYNVKGLNSYTTSNVLKGSGLSSSAAFEVMVGNMLNHLFNEGKVENSEIAIMAQWAENTFFGKPCGLMDQMACALGGFVNIDFKDPKNPIINKKNFDLTALNYNLCIVNTGGSHSDLNDDYASIPSEMKAVAGFFGKPVLRDITVKQLITNGQQIRKLHGDRAYLRALHFVNENERVDVISKAMDNGDIDTFLEYIEKSGNSSYKMLQNVYSNGNPSEQGISVALAVSEEYIASIDKKAVCRVHGGGFAGTMQAFIPDGYTEGYKKMVDTVMGEGSCMVMHVRPYGAIRIG